jgi:hypothetical protein
VQTTDAKEPAVHLEPLSELLSRPLLAVAVNPNPDALPGMPAAQKLVNGLAAAIILACVVGLLIGIGQWVLGSRTSNFSQADSGKSKVGVAVLGAFLTGAAAAIINFFISAGAAVK